MKKFTLDSVTIEELSPELKNLIENVDASSVIENDQKQFITKEQKDKIAEIDNKLDITGGTMTGDLTVGMKVNGGALTGANKQLICGNGPTVYVGNPTTQLCIESNATPKVQIGNSQYTMHHTGNTTPADIGACDTTILNNVVKTIRINGDANKYYPVKIGLGAKSRGYNPISISRSYAMTAPDSWNNPTHRGSMTLSVTWTGDVGWGGDYKKLRVEAFSYEYATQCAGMKLFNSGLVVWLRGGGADYYIESLYGSSTSVDIHLNGFTDSGGVQVGIRNSVNTSEIESEILSKWGSRANGEIYDSGNRVYSKNNRPYTISTASPSGGVNGDIWFKYT